ncbi:helix-turn-helix domain-containing protein [Nocardioides ungokensis]|uniref:helix-turn-helix domain-containing protein n=1 Tax=Nocardioides ungokensis TaxID=1643322 RepID=UPI0015E0401E|nr:PucR family transcriptional regulator [Nocardioides ungokensis]
MRERQRVHQLVRDDLDRVVPDVVATIREQIPAYRTLSPAQVEEVSAIAAWATSRILELWVEGGELAPADVQRFRGIGAARALDGRPLPVILRAYRVAGTRITDLVAELGGDRLTVDDALALARLWMASIDTLSEALYAGHSAATERVSGDRERALGDLLDDLLSGRQATRTALQDRCRELDVTLPARPRVLVTAAAVAPEEAVLARERDGTTVAVLAPAGSTGAGPGCLVEATDPGDVPRAHRLAELAATTAPGRAFADRAVLDEADAQVVALLAAHRDADPVRLATLVLSRVRDQAHLLAGLEAFQASGSATAAAELLDVHPQTMRHRLRRLVHLTGRDPRRPWDRFVLEVAATVRPAG